MQTTLTYLIIALAAGFALWRAYQVFRRANDPCYGCGGCALKELREASKKKKAECWHKK